MIYRLAVVAFFAALPLAGYGLDLRPQIDPLARRLLLGQNGPVGFVVGIVKDGQTQIVPYGETRKGSGTTPGGDTVYEIGSITKTFTGILLADMVQRGIVKLDAPVQDHLPESVKVPVSRNRPISLLHLATHTSGFPRRPDNMTPMDRMNPYADYSVQQMYDFLNRHWLRRPPGEFEYSNFAMGLLGHVLARQAGLTYEQLLADRILSPLGMHDTHHGPNPGTLERLAPPYDANLMPAKNWDLPTLAGAGGMRSTVNDMLKFIRANLAEDDTPLGRAIRLSHGKRHALPNGNALGLAWNISRSGQILFHGGSTGGYRAWLAVVPARGVGVVVLANTANAGVYRFGDTLLHLALGTPARPGDAAESAGAVPQSD